VVSDLHREAAPPVVDEPSTASPGDDPQPQPPSEPPPSDADGARPRRGLTSRDLTIGLAVLVVLLLIALATSLAVGDGDGDGGDDTADGSPSGEGIAGLGAPTDSFDRPDDATAIGVATNGDAWESLGATWGVQGGQLYMAVPPTGAAQGFALLDMGSGDGTVAATASTVRGGSGLVFRYQGPDDHWVVNPAADYGTWVVQHVVQGTPVVNENVGLTSTEGGSTILVELDGAEIRVVVNDGPALLIRDEAGADATMVGIASGGYGSADARWDSFYALPA